jgi:hypothetical protein
VCQCQSARHPQVPHTGACLFIEYCHQCMAWKVDYAMYTWDGKDTESIVRQTELEYGPFDGVEDVTSHAKAILSSLMLSPGRPWDHERETPGPASGGDDAA